MSPKFKFVRSLLIYLFYAIHIRMERQRREEELKGGRSSKKGQDAEQSILNRVGGLIP